MFKDDLGDRMKRNYENRTRILLPRRTHTIIRLDGKAFHSFVKRTFHTCKRPFDDKLMCCMNETAKVLCENIQGAQMAFVQSDEISILLTDFNNQQTDAWFDGNVQKMVSIAASTATAAFNGCWLEYTDDIDFHNMALFDARVFTIPEAQEVVNYFIWRQQDATRNSISMAAQSVYSHKELHGVSSSEQQELLHRKNINWNDYPVGFKRGRTVMRRKKIGPITYTDKRTGEVVTKLDVERNVWVVEAPPIFSKDPNYILQVRPSTDCT